MDVKTILPDDALLELLDDKVKHSKLMGLDLHAFDNFARSHPARNYQALSIATSARNARRPTARTERSHCRSSRGMRLLPRRSPEMGRHVAGRLRRRVPVCHQFREGRRLLSRLHKWFTCRSKQQLFFRPQAQRTMRRVAAEKEKVREIAHRLQAAGRARRGTARADHSPGKTSRRSVAGSIGTEDARRGRTVNSAIRRSIDPGGGPAVVTARARVRRPVVTGSVR